ncbi:MAG: hypothetical protein AABY10_04435, partial [Nanoarchaeota archaeon]
QIEERTTRNLVFLIQLSQFTQRGGGYIVRFDFLDEELHDSFSLQPSEMCRLRSDLEIWNIGYGKNIASTARLCFESPYEKYRFIFQKASSIRDAARSRSLSVS